MSPQQNLAICLNFESVNVLPLTSKLLLLHGLPFKKIVYTKICKGLNVIWSTSGTKT